MTSVQRMQLPHVQSMVKESINNVVYLCHGLAKEAGWWEGVTIDIHTGGFKISLIHSEVSEALEGLRKNLMDPHLPHRKNVEVEMADAVIRIMDFCGAYGLDLGGAMAEKLIYNTHREDHTLEHRAGPNGKKI